MKDRLSIAEQRALWNVVNQYAEACGGDTGGGSVSVRRMNAVVEVEAAVLAIINNNQPGQRLQPHEVRA